MLQFNTDPTEALTPFVVGNNYFFRLATYHCIGNIVSIVGKFIVLKDACWVADSGRFMQALQKGNLSEVEPTGDMVINIDFIADAFPWKHALPDKQI